jgi:hypothetical protein
MFFHGMEKALESFKNQTDIYFIFLERGFEDG